MTLNLKEKEDYKINKQWIVVIFLGGWKGCYVKENGSFFVGFIIQRSNLQFIMSILTQFG